MRSFFLMLTIVIVNCNLLNWKSLDRARLSRGENILFKKYGVNGYNTDPNPNSTAYITSIINNNYQSEDDLWSGNSGSEQTVTPTNFYLRAMLDMTNTISNYIRTSYISIYQDLDVSYCNYIKTAPEIVLDSNMGYGPNYITLNETDLSLLIPPPICRLPVGFEYGLSSSERYDTSIFFPYLVQLNTYYECIMLYNAYPSYTKGVNCLEDYYYGSQDASLNPNFFDLAKYIEDLKYALDTFYLLGNINVNRIDPTSWTDAQDKLEISRQYVSIARKIRTTAILTYTAMSKNYLRLGRLKTCKIIEKELYSKNTYIKPDWCDYESCMTYDISYELVGMRNNDTNDILPNGNSSDCIYSTCNPDETSPDPFYCDKDRPCPGNYYCSFVERRCYKSNMRDEYMTSNNKTICGISRKIVDANVIYGNINDAFSTEVNETYFTHNTFWPQNCTTQYSEIANTTIYKDYGPISINIQCYPFVSIDSKSIFYVNGRYNCSLLGNNTETFKNVSYEYYIDNEYRGITSGDFSVIRSGLASNSWQLNHCNLVGSPPNYFGDMNTNNTMNNTFCFDQTKTITICPSNTNTGSNITDCNSIQEIYGYCSGNDSLCSSFDGKNKIYGNCTIRSKKGYSCNSNGTNCVPCNNLLDTSTTFDNRYQTCSNSSQICAVFNVLYTVCGTQMSDMSKNDYMHCSTSSGCSSINSTHVCYSNVADTIRINDHYNTERNTTCTDVRIYGNVNNTQYGYVDPYIGVSSPPPYDLPAGYHGSGYTQFNSTQYSSISGSTTSGSPPPPSDIINTGNFVGFYLLGTSNTVRITGRISWNTVSGNTYYVEGKDMTLTFNSIPIFYELPTLSVDNTTGRKYYNPLVDPHPNPRYNDPNDCFFLQTNVRVNVPMVLSPNPSAIDFKTKWMDGISKSNTSPNMTPLLYPCTALFLRKVLYVQNNAWQESDSVDYNDGYNRGDLRYTCQRSLSMAASCSRFGSPMTVSQLISSNQDVNPPSEQTIFDLS